MKHFDVIAADPRTWLAGGADRPVHFYCPEALAAQHARFRAGFPGAVTFAVKANPAEAVIAQLAAEGMAAFDVASPEEMDLVARLAPGAALHYHNPVRSGAEISKGKAMGVVSWSVDCAEELEKLIAAGVSGEIAVRLALPVGGAAYQFGAKFGAGPKEVERLLGRLVQAGHMPALTFHVGTQCADPAAWTSYIAAAAGICGRAGVRIATLNVGGGFPSARRGAAPLEPILKAIAGAMEAFAYRPKLVCEPGRGLVGDAFSYAVQVKSRRGDALYLTDGIYGGLSECPSMGVPEVALIRGGVMIGGEACPMILWGPTCDSLDRLPGTVEIPGDVREGDWLLFASMGAYVTGVSTRFNGYGGWDTVAVSTL